jgi:hypothetical protein
MSKHTFRGVHVPLLRPFRRSAWLLLAWTQRHSVALWWRSLQGELRRGRPIDRTRVRRLAVALFRVASDPRLSNAAELKQLSLMDDVVVARTDEHWTGRPLLTTVLTGVPNVNEVRYA